MSDGTSNDFVRACATRLILPQPDANIRLVVLFIFCPVYRSFAVDEPCRTRASRPHRS